MNKLFRSSLSIFETFFLKVVTLCVAITIVSSLAALATDVPAKSPDASPPAGYSKAHANIMKIDISPVCATGYPIKMNLVVSGAEEFFDPYMPEQNFAVSAKSTDETPVLVDFVQAALRKKWETPETQYLPTPGCAVECGPTGTFPADLTPLPAGTYTIFVRGRSPGLSPLWQPGDTPHPIGPASCPEVSTVIKVVEDDALLKQAEADAVSRIKDGRIEFYEVVPYMTENVAQAVAVSLDDNTYESVRCSYALLYYAKTELKDPSVVMQTKLKRAAEIAAQNGMTYFLDQPPSKGNSQTEGKSPTVQLRPRIEPSPEIQLQPKLRATTKNWERGNLSPSSFAEK